MHAFGKNFEFALRDVFVLTKWRGMYPSEAGQCAHAPKGGRGKRKDPSHVAEVFSYLLVFDAISRRGLPRQSRARSCG